MVEKKIFKTKHEWLNARKSRIGGSDASCIVGMNPYKNNVDLWLEKIGKIEAEDISDKPYVQYGISAEVHLRELFKLDFPEYEVIYDENNMFLNDRYPFAHASLDGELIELETGRRGILEIKTTNILQSMQREKWNNRLPDNYYIQLIHYLLITEYDFAVLKAQLKSVFNNDETYIQTKHFKIERGDALDDIEYLRDKEQAFFNCIKSNRCPDLILPEI